MNARSMLALTGAALAATLMLGLADPDGCCSSKKECKGEAVAKGEADCAKGESCCKSGKSEGEAKTVANAEPTTECEKAAAGQCCLPPEQAALLEPLKKLAGDWDVDLDDNGSPDALVTYRVTAGGSAVIETEFAGMPHEMVTIYTVDGSDLLATHYCMGNQPRMRAKGGFKDGVATFAFQDATNLKPDAMHMHSLVVTIEGERVISNWTAYENGKPSEHKTIFSMTRRPAEGKAQAAR